MPEQRPAGPTQRQRNSSTTAGVLPIVELRLRLGSLGAKPCRLLPAAGSAMVSTALRICSWDCFSQLVQVPGAATGSSLMNQTQPFECDDFAPLWLGIHVDIFAPLAGV